MDYMNKFNETVNYIREKVNDIPKISIILGSGLGSLADDIEDKTIIPYKDIPNFPISTVAGHKGELIFGKLENIPIIAMNGRFHYYEGYDLKETTYPIRVFSLLGVKTLILTNAAGGINETFNSSCFSGIGTNDDNNEVLLWLNINPYYYPKSRII